MLRSQRDRKAAQDASVIALEVVLGTKMLNRAVHAMFCRLRMDNNVLVLGGTENASLHIGNISAPSVLIPRFKADGRASLLLDYAAVDYTRYSSQTKTSSL